MAQTHAAARELIKRHLIAAEASDGKSAAIFGRTGLAVLLHRNN